jgi:GNAT superfamily N-acetyltransferase
LIEQVNDTDVSDIIKLISLSIKTCLDVPSAAADTLIAGSVDEILWWKCHQKSTAHYIYRVDGNVVGTILIKDFCYISNLFVDPDFHHQGIGKQLILHALAICKRYSAQSTVKLNSSFYAEPFYQKMGFEQVGKAKDLPGGCIPFERIL